MIKILELNPERRNVVFETTAREMRVQPLIVEKDFWVCLTLKYLMNESKYRDHFIFKGGTSLSKCYGVIDRFSEDVDLIIKWDKLGFSDSEVYLERTKNQTYKFETMMNESGSRFIQNELKADLKANLASKTNGLEILSDEEDPMVLYVRYPHLAEDEYIKPSVKLEIGPVAAKTPVLIKEIAPYYNRFFDIDGDDKEFKTPVVDISRTFWEKLLILYSETNRPEDKKTPTRYFRHYYDVARIFRSDYFNGIIEKLGLFEEVRFFKNKYFRNNWSKLEECSLSTIRIIPTPMRMGELEKDYLNMKTMFFGQIPSFDEVIDSLVELETILHTL